MGGLGLADQTTFKYSGRWTLVTGGASGIGLACANHMAALGGNTVLLDLNAAQLDIASRHLARHGHTVRTHTVDITQTGRLEAFALELDEEGIEVENLVTAAGVLQPMHRIESLARDVHDKVWDVNYHGTFHCCRIWGERMRQRRGGSIVTVSSVTSLRPTPLLAYGPAKAALNALTASLAVSYAADGVRINAVAPGFTLTEALEAKFASAQRDSSRILATVPMKRFARPEEIASAVGFLLSDAASAITGITLPVDCGWLSGASWQTFEPLSGPPEH